MRVQFLTVIILLIAFNSWSKTVENNGVTIITVGSAGSTCDISTGTTKIQDGIDSGFSAVHIVNSETYNENIVIDDRNITIVGGFATCSDAANGIRNANDKSIIDGSSNLQSTIRIFGNTFSNTVDITGLEITGGTSNALGGGGILAFGADATITLKNVLIDNNVGRFGGGIGMIVSGTTNLIAIDTIIQLNQADEGGGLYCNYTGVGLSPQIIISQNSGISQNGAVNGPGGGIFLNTCDLHFASGDENFNLNIGINNNLANMQGGGIYAEDAATINLIGDEAGCGFICTGDNTKPVTIAGNTAQGNGGGVFLTGFATQMDMNMVLLINNTSNLNGGGIAIENNAIVNVTRSQKECWNQSHCNFFRNNKSGESAGLGGLIYNNGATANINQAEIAFNRADFGTVLYSVGAGSSTTFNGCIIHDNGGTRIGAFPHDDKYVFRVAGGAQVDAYHTTIADNLADVAVFGIASSSGSVSEIHNSIIHDISSGAVIDNNFGPVDFNSCLLHEMLSLNLPPFPIRNDLRVEDPLFVNRVGKNYHIDPINSRAIDFASSDNSTLADMDFETRGIDIPSVLTLLGPYDVGADEAQRPDAMFSDGFEN
jgi:hypothetical protein